MVDRLLFVCAQNVCRSAYLEAATAARLDELGCSVVVLSRGTAATSGHSMCTVAAHSLGDEMSGRAGAHRSRQLTARDLERADLVLTASAAERAVAAQLDPGARTRVFTVREAIALAAVDTGTPLSAGASLSAVAAELQRRRGLGAMPSPRPSRWPWRRRGGESPFDIPDRHREGAGAHRRLFSELQADAVGVVSLFAASPVDASR